MLYRFASGPGDEIESHDSIYEDFRSDIEQRNTPLALHDNESVDIKTARQIANELINAAGAEVNIYMRTDNADYDSIWDEDPDPTYWNKISLKACFKAKPLEVELVKWGADTSNSTEVAFSHHQLHLATEGRMLRVGDVIQLPYNSAAINPKNYRVLNASPTGNFRYVWLYFTCQVDILTADITVRPENDMTEDEPADYQQYRESL